MHSLSAWQPVVRHEILGEAIPDGDTMHLLLNGAEAVDPVSGTGTQRAGSTLKVQRTAAGTAVIAVRDIRPSEVAVVSNHAFV